MQVIRGSASRVMLKLRPLIWLSLLSYSLLAQAASPVMMMHEVAHGETWRNLAARHQLTERQLRLNYNRARFMTPLTPGDWIWLPKTQPDARYASAQAVAVTHLTLSDLTPSHLANTTSLNSQALKHASAQSTAEPDLSSTPLVASRSILPSLGPPNPSQAPKGAKLKLTLASAVQAAANQKLDKFVEQQSSSLADSTLSFGSAQLSDWLWLNPEHWSWDYQLPLFDKELLFNSRMALPLTKQLQGEVGVDYRDQRVTYQAGLNIEQALSADLNVHLEPVLDYQADWEHQRGGVLVYLADDNWTLGAGQYQPLSGWQRQEGRSERAAAGQVLFGEGQLGWLPGLSVSSQYYQWQGRRLNLYGSGDKYKAPMSQQWSLNYTPWRIFRLQTSLLSNSKDKFESRLRLGVEFPLGVEPGQWWRNLQQHTDYRHYQPLQHHQVLVLEQK